MNSAAKYYYIILGLFTLAGGVMGCRKTKSKASLVAGIVCGLGLFTAAVLMPYSQIGALVTGLMFSILLAGKFLPDFIYKKAVFPGGLMALLSISGIVITVLALNRK